MRPERRSGPRKTQINSDEILFRERAYFFFFSFSENSSLSLCLFAHVSGFSGLSFRVTVSCNLRRSKFRARNCGQPTHMLRERYVISQFHCSARNEVERRTRSTTDDWVLSRITLPRPLADVYGIVETVSAGQGQTQQAQKGAW